MTTETLGQFLKKEREFRNVTLGQLAKDTKLTMGVLEKLERDDLDGLPSGTYFRGYLKLVAESLGIPIEEMMTRYRQQPVAVKKEVDPFYQLRRFENQKDHLPS